MNFVIKKYVLSLALILVAFGQGFAEGECADGTKWGDFTTMAATDSDGNGFYEINSPEKLAWFACVTTRLVGDYLKMKVELTSDIDLGGNLFIPISEHKNGGNKFAGTINGQNHTIRGLYIKGSEIIKPANGGAAGYAQNVGLVSVLTKGGIIENLVLEVAEIYASSSAGGAGSQGSTTNPVSVGTLVGWMEGGTIRNCVVEGNITSSGNQNRVGGLAGNVWSATITDCVSNVSISASGTDTHVGGVVGALRKGGTVNLASCVFDGDTLISTGGTAGGIVGYHEDATVNANNLYYTGAYDGTGKPKDGVTIPTNQTPDEKLNSEEVVCALNKGTWDDVNKTCDEAKSDVWSEGQTGISMNGSDGYKVSFSANGGSFGSGAKTFKIVANGATITADEITAPTRTNPNMEFAGWATTSTAVAPSEELGVANTNTTIYAVWYNIYTITFKISDSESHAIFVPKNGHVSVEGFSVPTSIEVSDPEDEDHKIKYYFTGWNYEQMFLDGEDDLMASDTLHLAGIKVFKDTTLFPVWTKAETYSVTFDATLHGKTHVRFVKKVNDGDKVEKPNENDIVTNPGYAISGWLTEDGKKYDFNKQLKSNLALYAEWDTLSYKITYVMNGGTNDGNNPSTYTVQSDNIIFAVPTRAGYTFEGWFYDEGFTQPATGIATNTTTGDKTLYAGWIQQFYTVEYLSGNEVSATIVADKKPWGESVTLKGDEVAFQREGYIHDGWSLTPGGSMAYNFGATYNKYEDLVLYPHWVEGSPDAVHNGAVTIYTYADHKEAVINGDYKGLDAFSIDEDIPVESVVLERTFTPYVPVTMTLPFEIEVANVSGAKFYMFDGISIDGNGKKAVEANRVKTGTLSANTPYMVIPLETTIQFDGPVVLRETVEPVTRVGNWEFVGTYSYKTVAQENVGSIYGFAGSAEGTISQGQFAKFGAGSYFISMRAYLLNTEVSNRRLAKSLYARSVSEESVPIGVNWNDDDEIGLDEQTTTVRKIMKVPSIQKMDRIFDLNGRRVNDRNKSKGFYISR